MRNVRATVEYDGTDFSGFQRQRNSRTVQAEIECALAAVVGFPVPVVAAGRTDAGVHATGQVVSFQLSTRLDDQTLRCAVNANLPQDIVIRETHTVSSDFHARRSAVARTYQYRIIQQSTRPVLDRQRGWYVARDLDVAAIRTAADEFLGSHDFSAFTVRSVLGTVRDVFNVAVWRELDSVFFRIDGNAFLHRMVRRMVGTLVRVGRDELALSDVRTLLRGGPRSMAGPAAPAHGLTLVHVSYATEQGVLQTPHAVEVSTS